jgi:hypothetical protein
MKLITITLFILTSIPLVGQGINDSTDYVALRLLTNQNCWLYKNKFDPFSRLTQDELDYLKSRYKVEEMFLIPDKDNKTKKWNRQLVGDRKLKGKNIFYLPRRKPVDYLSYVRYLNDDKTIGVVYRSTWADIGFRNSSGSGDSFIIELSEGIWKIKETLGGFTTNAASLQQYVSAMVP